MHGWRRDSTHNNNNWFIVNLLTWLKSFSIFLPYILQQITHNNRRHWVSKWFKGKLFYCCKFTCVFFFLSTTYSDETVARHRVSVCLSMNDNGECWDFFIIVKAPLTTFCTFFICSFDIVSFVNGTCFLDNLCKFIINSVHHITHKPVVYHQHQHQHW